MAKIAVDEDLVAQLVVAVAQLKAHVEALERLVKQLRGERVDFA